MKRLFAICTLSLGLMCSTATGLTVDRGSRIYVKDMGDSLTMRGATVLNGYLERMGVGALPMAKKGGGGQIIRLVAGDASLGAEGFHILSDGGGGLTIMGNTGRGVLNGVYELLDKYMGCRYYSKEVVLVPRAKSVTLPDDIDDRQVPVVTFRDPLYTGTNDAEYIDWHRLNHDTRGAKPDWGLWVHTFSRLVPPKKHFAQNPDYYALVNGQRTTAQLCLSNPAVLEIVCENLAKEILRKPEATYWSVSPDDNFSYCRCAQCAAADSLDGSATGSVIQFVNKVADRFPNKVISTLAYQYSRAAPKVTKPRPNVNIMFCNIECNRSLPIVTDPSSASFRQDMVDWGALTDNILVWDYVIQFKNLVSPFPNFHTLQPNLKFFVDNSVVAMFEQGNREVGGEFADLRGYVVSKLLWNPYANADSLISDFCNGYYGAGGQFIKEYIDLLTNNLLESKKSLGIFGSPCDGADSYLSAKNLELYNAIFDKAAEATKSDSATLLRVEMARQPLLYAYLEQTKLEPYGPNGIYTRSEKGEWEPNPKYLPTLERFHKLCGIEGTTRLSEWHTTPDEYFNMMRAVSVVRTEGPSFEKQVTIAPAPHKSYGRDADKVLTNGIHATNDYKIQWLGWSASPVILTMDLEKSQPIKQLSVRCLQYLADWIFAPDSVVYEVSENGKTFTEVGVAARQMNDRQAMAAENYNLTVPAGTTARYVRATLRGVGNCPHWHSGAGSPAFTFADEFSVD